MKRSWEPYGARAGILSTLISYDQREIDEFFYRAVALGKNLRSDPAFAEDNEVDAPNVMILDTFLSDDADRDVLKTVFGDKASFAKIHILLADPTSEFARAQPSVKSPQGTERKLRKGLANIIEALGGDRPDEETTPLDELVNSISKKGGERGLELRFYRHFPGGPVFLFNHVLVCGRFGVNKDCNSLPWHMVINYPKYPDDLFDEYRKEFRYIWNDEDRTTPTLQRSESKPRSPGVAIVCALADEWAAVRDVFKQAHCTWTKQAFADDGFDYWQTEIVDGFGQKIPVVAAHQTQMGLTAATNLTTKIISRFQPRLVIMVGIAAGLRKAGLNFGDILVADKAVDYASGKWRPQKNGVPKLEPDPNPIKVDARVHALLSNRSKSDEHTAAILNAYKTHSTPPAPVLKLEVTTLGSADQVVADPSIHERAKRGWRKLGGVEMEVYGVYFAAVHTMTPPPHFFCLKAVSDYADRNKDKKGTESWRPYAMHTAANYCYRFLVHDAHELLREQRS